MVEPASHPPDQRLIAFVERVLERARLPAPARREARDDFLEHLYADVERRIQDGIDRDRAIADAIAEFGRTHDLQRALEAGAEPMTRMALLSHLQRDLGCAIRALWRRPVISVAAIATLALGIGVNGAVFSVVDWVLVRPLPYPAPHELVRVHTAGTDPVTPPGDVTHTEFAAVVRSNLFRSVVGFSSATRIVAAPGIEPAHVVVARITGDLSETLGVFPILGRTLARDELSAGAPLVILSHALWDRQFHRDANVIAKTITIDGTPHTVIGVMPPGRGYPPAADLWRPITAAEREDDDRELRVVGRLAADASVTGANAALSTLAQSLSEGKRTAWAEPMQQTEVKDVERALTALLGAAMLILLIACANVGALIAASGTDRGAEISVREALGASRIQLMGQLLTESIVLAVSGGVLGLLLGRLTLDAIIAIAPASLPRVSEIALDLRVVGVGIAASLIVGVIVGLAPAFKASRSSGAGELHGAGANRITRRSNGRRVLVAAQVAMAVILSVGAGLLAESLRNLINTRNGFDAERLISIDLYLRGSYEGDSRQLFQQLIDTTASVPGVSSVAVAMGLPTQTIGLRAPITIVGGSAPALPAVLRPISESYFKTAAIVLQAGRSFSNADSRSAPRVAIVNAAAVRAAFSDRAAIGSRITTPLIKGPLEIVGVVDDVTPGGESDRPALYVPITQLSIGSGYLLVRTEQDPASMVAILRERVRAIAPAIAVDRVELVRHTLEASRSATRFNTVLAGTFAVLALLLAVIGVYGLTASEVAARWRELAVRLALGASHYQALWTVLRPCALVLIAGAATGIAGAIAIAPRLAALLYQVEPGDVAVLTTAPVLLAGVGILAAAIAAIRVLHADPAATLRNE